MTASNFFGLPELYFSVIVVHITIGLNIGPPQAIGHIFTNQYCSNISTHTYMYHYH